MRLTLVALLLSFVTSFAAEGRSGGEVMADQDRRELNGWLEQHHDQRLASAADCDCQNEISELRRGLGTAWPAQSNYQPYYARGDFDGNGLRDFAVIIQSKDQPGHAQVLIFLRENASHASKILSRPVDRADLKGFGLFVGKRDGKRTRLLAGTFGSEGYELDIK